MSSRPFVPARDARFYLLQAHRQPIPANVANRFVLEFTAPGDLILDPFAASDALVRAAVEQGRRIVAADSNPLVAWAARAQATLPVAREINRALVRLGEMRKEGEPLRAYIAKFYSSFCGRCGKPVNVDYFIHRQEGAKTLLAEKVYVCAECGGRRDDVTEGDRQRAADAVTRGLSYHLLVERIVAGEAAHSGLLKGLLGRYTTRNLMVLAAVTQKLDAEFRDDAGRNVMAALLLHALDVGSSLYAAPGAMPAREVPPEFIEMNIWRALELAARGLGERPPALRLATTPAQVMQGTTAAAYIGQGGARSLAESSEESALSGTGSAKLILSSPARLDPAFWEMSFLWTRWLLGKTAAAPLEPLMDDERQRWGWYGKALTNAMSDAMQLAAEDATLAVAFPAGSHAMIEALMLAAAPHARLQDFAFRPIPDAPGTTEFGALRGEYQAIWKREAVEVTPTTTIALMPRIQATTLRAGLTILAARNEPLAYSWVHHAALEALAHDHLLAETLETSFGKGDNAFQFLRHRMEAGFKEGYRDELDHLTDEDGLRWFRREPRDETKREPLPLAERVERTVWERLTKSERTGAEELEDGVLAKFPGLLTPESELVELCARTYADLYDGEWVRRARDTDWQSAHALVAALGEKLGYAAALEEGKFDRLWRAEIVIPGSASGSLPETRVYENAYAFLFRERVDFEELVRLDATPLRGLVVLPEAQVDLTRERLRRDPRWRKKLEHAGWEFLRLPFVRALLSETRTERPEFQLFTGLDPAVAHGQEQMELF